MKIVKEFILKEYTTPLKSSKELFNKNYMILLDKELFPRKEACLLSIIEVQKTILENPNFPTYKKDYLFEIIKELKKY